MNRTDRLLKCISEINIMPNVHDQQVAARVMSMLSDNDYKVINRRLIVCVGRKKYDAHVFYRLGPEEGEIC